MNEKEFRARYARAQRRIKATPALKARTITGVQAGPSAEVLRSPIEQRSRRKASNGKPTPRRDGRNSPSHVLSAKRWAAPAAACLLVAILVAAGAPLLILKSEDAGQAIDADKAAELSGFAVRAYAADGSTSLSFGEGGMVVFDRDLGERLPGGDDYKANGFFTGCLFHVEGADIARVQANLSSGALYRVKFEPDPPLGSPQSRELSGWKPNARGTGEYYGGYDFVGGTANGEVSLAKLLGSTIDVSASDDSGIADGTTSFGLWTNEGDAPDDSANNPQSPLIDLFNGQKLTITVTFNDGRTSTQVIELHAANFKADRVNGWLKLTTQLASDDDSDGTLAVKSLYGIVVKANDEAFPLPLDDANDRASEVLPAPVMERMDDTSRAKSDDGSGQLVEDKLPRDGLVAPDRSIDFAYPYTAPGAPDAPPPAHLTISNPTLALSDTIPDGKTLATCNIAARAWLGNFNYMNKCSHEIWGYGFNDDGTLTSDDYRYVTTTVTVKNPGDTAVSLQAPALYEFALRHDDGTLDIVRTGYELDTESSGDTLPSDDPQQVTIAPGGTVQISTLRVLPVSMLSDDALVLVPNDSEHPYGRAFALGPHR